MTLTARWVAEHESDLEFGPDPSPLRSYTSILHEGTGSGSEFACPCKAGRHSDAVQSMSFARAWQLSYDNPTPQLLSPLLESGTSKLNGLTRLILQLVLVVKVPGTLSL